MNKILALLLMATALFSCTCNKNSEAKGETSDAAVMMVDEPQDLSEYEYVCAHCQLGSHEAGQCPCGMDYEKNPNFAGNMNHDGHDHSSDDLNSYEYVCSHCQKGSHEAGQCACGMDMEKNPNFQAES